MSDLVDGIIKTILQGLPLDEKESEICDFTIQEQNAALESQGIAPSCSSTFVPIIKETVTYIVAVLIVNENNEVLMVQEAKDSCNGKWYLPAGRVNKNETFYNGAIREVMEEAGLEVECTTLLKIETATGMWMRFSFIGEVKGGRLKTLSESDKESLQAQWISNINDLSLRANDIIPLIERARQYKAEYDSSWYKKQLVSSHSHTKVLLRLVIVAVKKSTNSVNVLLSEKTSLHLPVCELHPKKSLHSTLRRFMMEMFGAGVPQHKPHGILTVEHNPSKGDGVCLTLLVVFRPPLEEISLIGKCSWHETSKDVGNQLMAKVSSKNSTIPLHVIC